MAQPTLCFRCGDAEGEGFDPWDELEEVDAFSEILKFKRYDLTRNIIQLFSALELAPTFCNRCRDTVEEGCDPWDELDELDALSERLKLKRYDLERKINHRAFILQLPLDVTLTIFEFCLPDFTDHQSSPYTKGDFSIPLSLGAICSSWREVAWSTPSLWSSFVVRVTRKHDSHIVTGIAREWLARSGQLPLSIRIYAVDACEAVSALVNIIYQYSTRWSDLDLYMPSYFCEYFHATDNHAPILKSIRFHCSAKPKHWNLQNFQLSCPRLERAYFSFTHMDRSNIQLDNITHLTLHFISIIDAFFILRKSPRLVFCKFSGSCSSYNIGPPVLTSMRSLQLDLNTIAANDFLNNLIAPYLEEFSLPKKRYRNPSTEVIASFLERSACSLRSFSTIFSFFPVHLEGFMRLLQSMPSLNTLSITATSLNYFDNTPKDFDLRNILQLVAKVLSSQSTSFQREFLPNLQILEYSGKLYLCPGHYDDLYSFPSADNAVHGPLHLLKLNLYPATRIPKDMISYLSGLVERGVTVNVLSKSGDILQSSIDYHRFKKDVLFRDWSDNLDSNLFFEFCGVSQVEK